ncbi:INO80 complex subunit B [Latimeria chalumnae]|uniref:INO80 complex subunit B n=1 Tax=Latimeria chalumnae TaxID=7897 RepID=UPI0006D90772|nr:PREDICTED: INO80 complex subunit B [Latimeria chalumnae]|eukprot:XP_014349249.1 PREDICTED: INO80 complex subunit B [Latimeria chalumnae]
MGKKKDAAIERFARDKSGDHDDLGSHSAHKKKHKKHKKHKKKHHPEEGGHSFSSETLESDSGAGKPQLKLKIKLGGQTLGTKSVPAFTVIPEIKHSPSPLMVVDDDDDDDDEPMEGVPIEQYRAWLDEDSNLDPSPLPDVDSECLLEHEDEEERWLDALEKGELDDNGELKREIDESLLTARQRALLHKQQSQPLLELPMGYKEKEMTEEMMLKREERARKRRLQAAKKAEENKNQTIERLTKTNKAKVKTLKEKKSKQSQCPMVRYSNTVEKITISFPQGIPAPLPSTTQPLRPIATCGVGGCTNKKKYSCSKTGVPLCSLECYKKNMLV